ncbi:MAG TPA: hypothetical protein VF941_03905 [Clostridia bacterium]
MILHKGKISVVTIFFTLFGIIWCGNINNTACAEKSISASGKINIAACGIGYKWFRNISSSSNSNKYKAPGLNDGNKTIDTDLTSSGQDDVENAYESAGIIWTTSQMGISKVKFTNGSFDRGCSGVFTNDLKMQVSYDGTTWADSGWTYYPQYNYDSKSAARKTYTFTGGILNNIVGLRITGQVHTHGQFSYHVHVAEVEVFGTGKMTIKAPTHEN